MQWATKLFFFINSQRYNLEICVYYFQLYISFHWGCSLFQSYIRRDSVAAEPKEPVIWKRPGRSSKNKCLYNASISLKVYDINLAFISMHHQWLLRRLVRSEKSDSKTVWTDHTLWKLAILSIDFKKGFNQIWNQVFFICIFKVFIGILRVNFEIQFLDVFGNILYKFK